MNGEYKEEHTHARTHIEQRKHENYTSNVIKQWLHQRKMTETRNSNGGAGSSHF